MEDMNELQMTCFEIISYVGTAKSMYINAVQKAKEGDFTPPRNLSSRATRLTTVDTMSIWGSSKRRLTASVTAKPR